MKWQFVNKLSNLPIIIRWYAIEWHWKDYTISLQLWQSNSSHLKEETDESFHAFQYSICSSRSQSSPKCRISIICAGSVHRRKFSMNTILAIIEPSVSLRSQCLTISNWLYSDLLLPLSCSPSSSLHSDSSTESMEGFPLCSTSPAFSLSFLLRRQSFTYLHYEKLQK